MHHYWSHLYRSKTHLLITLAIFGLPSLLFLLSAMATHLPLWSFFISLIISLARLIVSYCISLLFAWGAALLFYHGRPALIALPIFDVLQSFPAFAALPFAVAWFGASNLVVIFFLIIAIIWPLFFSAVSSLKLAKHDWLEAVTMARLTPWQHLCYVLVPLSIPGIMTGSIIGLGEGWEALVATEIITRTPRGIGHFFQNASTDGIDVAVGIVGLLLVIFFFNKLALLPLLEWSHRQVEE